MGRPLDQDRDHRITLPEAAEQARRQRSRRPSEVGDIGAFNAKAVRALLDQPGCVGMRYYRGRNAKGERSLVLVGVDAEGNDMVDGVVLDDIYPCPPYCSDDNALNG